MKEYYVYKHTFPNGKVYIGITCQKPENRWNGGFGYLVQKKDGEYSQPLMARAILKYGWDNILHEILFFGLTKEEAEAKEIELIAQYKSDNSQFGYNIQHGGSVNKHSEETKRKLSEFAKTRIGDKNPNYGKHTLRGKKMSDTTKQKLSESKKGHEVSQNTRIAVSESNKKRAKRVIQYDTDMNLIKIWNSAEEAHIALSINKSSINACCRGDSNRKTAGGFIWRYYEEEVIAA